MKTKDKISGYIIRSGAWAVFLSVAFIALSSAVNSQTRQDESQKAQQAGARVRPLNQIPLASPSNVHEAWVGRYNGPGNGDDYATAMAVDTSGNVYVTGESFGAGTDIDYATIKYNSAGQRQWVARYNGPGNSVDTAQAIAVDSSGNVYVTGESIGSESDIDGDYATIKYNSAGQRQWVARYDGPEHGRDYAVAIAVNSLGSVYVTGGSVGGSGPSHNDYATIKYNWAGQQQWVARYDYSDDGARAIAMDRSGNVYVTGASGPPAIYDYATVKYNPAGQQQWVARYDGPWNNADIPSAMVVDGSGYIYVTGYSFGDPGGYATIKYNAAGQQVWVARYAEHGSPSGMAVDTSGNVYVTGGGGCGTQSSGYVTIKYNSAGQEQWVAQYCGAFGSGYAKAIAVDNSANVYVTGRRRGFGGGYDYATVKYNAAGQQQWVVHYDGPAAGTHSSDDPAALAVDGLGNVYVTGYSVGLGTGLDYATIKYVQTPPNDDFADAMVISTASGSLVGTNKSSTTEVGEPAGENSVWYSWTAPNNGEAHFRIGMDWLTIDVYTGTAINALTRIATSSGNPSSVHWTVVAGTTYRIRLTKNTRTSPFMLVWSL